MNTIFDQAARDGFLARLANLTPDTPRRWGRFTAPRMVAHVNDSMRMALGELSVAPKKSPLRTAFLRWLVIHVLPFPRSAPTAPELLVRGNDGAVRLDAERATFSELLAKLASREGSTAWPEHPAFGTMTGKDWGTLGYKHVNHHFKQFGI